MKLLPLMIAIPLGVAFILPLLPKKRPRMADCLAVLATLALLALAAMLIGQSGVYAVGGWRPPVGIVLVLDGLSWLVLITVALVSFLVTVFSARYMEQYTARGRYYALFMLMVAGMNGAVLTGDMFNLYVFIEVAAVASYALVAFGCHEEELEASFKYAVLGSIASSFILLGIALMYCLFGTVNMAHLGQKVSASGLNRAAIFSLVLFIAGFGLKAALVPFHAWLPDAHPSAPAPISAMLSGVLIKAIGVYALIRVLFNVFGVTAQVATALMVLGTISMVVAILMALIQWDLKRLLAYSSISQIGYVMLGFGVGGAVLAAGGSPVIAALGFLGALFHLVNHAVFKSLLFLSSGALEYATGTRQLKEMGGLGKEMPLTAGASLVASLAIGGVPPLNGFFSKLIIILACVSSGHYGFALAAVLVSIFTLAVYMKVQKYAFLGKPAEGRKSVHEVPAAMRIPMTLLAVLCLGMSLMLLPGPKKRVLDPAVQVLMDRDAYIQSVMGVASALGAGQETDMKIAEN